MSCLPDGLAIRGHDVLLVGVDDAVALRPAQVVLQEGSARQVGMAGGPKEAGGMA